MDTREYMELVNKVRLSVLNQTKQKVSYEEKTLHILFIPRSSKTLWTCTVYPPWRACLRVGENCWLRSHVVVQPSYMHALRFTININRHCLCLVLSFMHIGLVFNLVYIVYYDTRNNVAMQVQQLYNATFSASIYIATCVSSVCLQQGSSVLNHLGSSRYVKPHQQPIQCRRHKKECLNAILQPLALQVITIHLKIKVCFMLRSVAQ